MNYRTILLAGVAASLLFACAAEPKAPGNPRIDWDEWGVPHITAEDPPGLFFADGWAQMEAHANLLLQLYGVSRGRAAEYWGADYLDSDRLVHTLAHPAKADRMVTGQDPELRALLTAFTDGINAWAAQNPDAIAPDKRVVLPVNPRDVNLHSLFVVNTRFVAGRELGLARRWDDTGSNAMAIAPRRSASGNAMLLQNPHLPWSGEFLFFEKHLRFPGHNLYGVHLVGMPGLAIGFNQHLGWTHTNNPIDNADLYELERVDDGYRFGSEQLAFETTYVELKVREDDGTLSKQELVVRRSVHGPVIRMGERSALALRLVGDGLSDSLLQWWRMAAARDFEEFGAALDMDQLPFWNIMYADRAGNILYLFNGHIPRRSQGDWDYWQGIVDGSDPATLWTEVHARQELPRALNPPSGWLQNANDPPWSSTHPAALASADYPPYFSERGMAFRPQRAVRMLLADESISFDELVDIKHDTRMELADRLMDELLAAVAEHGDETAREAASVLAAWDRRADNDSRGAVLFQEWALLAMRSGKPLFAQAWLPTRPIDTPDGLADPAAMAELLSTAAGRVRARHGRLDVPWGEVNRIQHGAADLPANGAASEFGVFRVAAARPGDEATQKVLGGDTWVAVIEFAEIPRARVLLSYGNASQPGSPHATDQFPLFSRQALREARFTAAQLQGHVVRSEVLPAPSLAD